MLAERGRIDSDVINVDICFAGVSKYPGHYPLKVGWAVFDPKGHLQIFIFGPRYRKAHLWYVFRGNWHLVESFGKIEHRDVAASTSSSENGLHIGNREGVRCSNTVECLIVYAQSNLPLCLGTMMAGLFQGLLLGWMMPCCRRLSISSFTAWIFFSGI